MGNALTIDAKSLGIGADKIEKFSGKLVFAIDKALETAAKEIERVAKDLAPGDRGFLRQNIIADTDTFLQKSVAVHAPYGAYVEFGTGRYAAQYVAGLPGDWQTFAAQYKGPANNGNFKQFVKLIAEWMKRKGITGGIYSVKTKRRQGSAVQKRMEDLSLAYVIARSIYIKGVKSSPFLYPAYQGQQRQLIDDIKNSIAALQP